MRPVPEEGGAGSTGTGPPALSLVVPAFNEATRLAAGLQRLRDAAAASNLDLETVEVIVVDDGSSDATASSASAMLEDLPLARIVTLPRNLGKGAAVRAGILAATGRKVAFADADMAIDPLHLPALVTALDRADVAVGSRAVRGRVDYGTRLRTEAGRGFNLAVRAVGGVALADTQCGFKGFNRGPALLLAHLQTTSGYAFDVELLWLSTQLGLRLEVVPVSWLDVPGSTVRPLHDSSRMLADLFAARRRRRYLAVADLDGPLAAPAPRDAVVVGVADGELLCGAVSDLGELRLAVGHGRVRCLDLAGLVERSVQQVEPAR